MSAEAAVAMIDVAPVAFAVVLMSHAVVAHWARRRADADFSHVLSVQEHKQARFARDTAIDLGTGCAPPRTHWVTSNDCAFDSSDDLGRVGHILAQHQVVEQKTQPLHANAAAVCSLRTRPPSGRISLSVQVLSHYNKPL